MKVATLAQAFNLPVCSHGMQELHVSLLAAVPNQGWLEVSLFCFLRVFVCFFYADEVSADSCVGRAHLFCWPVRSRGVTRVRRVVALRAPIGTRIPD
eukprot:COSAG01_NODE_11196_length_1981_cov_1.828738_1_plen_97_part_00